MASDWIKMRTELYRDPKVCIIADALLRGDGALAGYVNQNMQCAMTVTRNVMRNAVVGALVAVWGISRHRGKRVGDHLFLRNVGLEVLDDMADISGFGSAMAAARWVVARQNGLVFPRFFEDFNVEVAEDHKAKNAARQRRFREKHSNAQRNVTVTSQSNDREEKSREEKSNAYASVGVALPDRTNLSVSVGAEPQPADATLEDSLDGERHAHAQNHEPTRMDSIQRKRIRGAGMLKIRTTPAWTHVIAQIVGLKKHPNELDHKSAEKFVLLAMHVGAAPEKVERYIERARREGTSPARWFQKVAVDEVIGRKLWESY